MRYRSVVALIAAIGLVACSEKSVTEPTVRPSKAYSEMVGSQVAARAITSDGQLFASRLRGLRNENELIIWLKNPSESRPSEEAILGDGTSPTVVGRPTQAGQARPSVRLPSPRSARGTTLLRALAARGIEPYLRGRSMPWVAVRLPDDAVEGVVSLLMTHPEVDWFEANQTRRFRTTAAPLGSNATGNNHAAHRVSGAWDHTRGSGATIGVLDTGFAGDASSGAWHPDGTDYGTYGIKKLGFVDDGGGCNSTEQADGECLANDDQGHGTYMTGLVGANDNSIHSVGISPLALTYSMKVAFNALRPGLTCGTFPFWDDEDCFEDEDIVAALDWASDEGLDVVSMSFVANVGTSVIAALSYAYNSYDVLLLAGVGNKAGEPTDIMSSPWVMGVGGMYNDSTVSVGAYPQYWEIGGFSGGRTLRASCSGTSICTLASPYDVTLDPGGGGASSATANVAAIAALVRAAAPTLTNAQVRSRLTGTASGVGVRRIADAEWAVENVTKLFVAISGPDEVNDDSNHTWTANPNGGLGGNSYVWELSEDGGPWGVVGTSQSYVLAVQEEDPDFELRVTVTSSGRRARATKTVLVCIPEVCNN